MWKFPGQEMSLCHSGDLSHWGDNVRSSTCCATRELPKHTFFKKLPIIQLNWCYGKAENHTRYRVGNTKVPHSKTYGETAIHSPSVISKVSRKRSSNLTRASASYNTEMNTVKPFHSGTCQWVSVKLSETVQLENSHKKRPKKKKKNAPNTLKNSYGVFFSSPHFRSHKITHLHLKSKNKGFHKISCFCQSANILGFFTSLLKKKGGVGAQIIARNENDNILTNY